MKNGGFMGFIHEKWWFHGVDSGNMENVCRNGSCP